jgi:hypothetical protein
MEAHGNPRIRDVVQGSAPPPEDHHLHAHRERDEE